MKQISYTIILFFLSGILSAKNIGPSTYGKLKNNAELVVIKDTNSDLRLTMNLKIAPYIEISKNAGISRLLMYTVYCNLVRLDNTYKNTEVIFHPDYSSFVFHLENKDYAVERIVSNIYKAILIDSGVLNQAKALTIQSYQRDIEKQSKEAYELDDQIQQYVWGDYHFRKYQRIEETVLNQITGYELYEMYNKYYRPVNTLFLLCGPVNTQTKFDEISETTLYEDKIEYNYVPIGKTNIYKSLISSSQLIHKDIEKKAANKAVITYQITGNYQHANGYYKLMILCEVLNKISPKAFPDVKDMMFTLKTEKYAAELSISYTPVNLEKSAFYHILEELNNIKIDSFITQKEYTDLLLQIVNQHENEKQKAYSLASNLVYWWNIQSIDSYATFENNVKSIPSYDVYNIYNKYIRNCHFVLMINDNNLINPGEELTIQSVDDTSVESVFYYDYNISDITRESEKEKLWKVLQWLYINKNLSIQVNGHADRNEYLKSDATELKEFIEQYPQFKVVSSKIGKGSWQRLDMVRAIKVAKFLIDNGINFNRVKGSGLLLDSEDRDKMQENQKVDFSYSRFRIEQE